MCTALTFHGKDHYFGRNLDLEYSYHETVTITPRNFPLPFRILPTMERHHALIGMAFVANDYPLYYDAVNEHGLAMAGLNFPGNAHYSPTSAYEDNVTPFEFIPWLLGQCITVADARALLRHINLLDEAFSSELPLSPLHWIIADKEEAIVVEAMEDGLHIYDNPVGVLTNNPPFDFMLHHLANHRDVSPAPSENRFSDKVDLPVCCVGLAGLGLPGDYSSPSRFVKAAFVKLNALPGETEAENVVQFFHLLGAVEMPKGCVRLEGGKNDITIYSACCNQDTGMYYYITYNNRQITAVDLHKVDLEGTTLHTYPLREEQSIVFEN